MPSTITPYLNFNGDCREALTFYAQLFDAAVEMMSYGDSPVCDEMPPGTADYVMHAQLSAGSLFLMASDAPPGMYQKPAGLSVALAVDSVEEAERVYSALAEGGQVIMALEETFWAHRFAMVTDRFGTPWMINCLKPCVDT